ncbi:MAG TPA: hypothetical protein VJ998_12895, partial [Pseudomonadales bacterium]|nr:hypothetical protein [Pseudomonadales bacterium]
LRALGETATETPLAWLADDDAFAQMTMIDGLEYFYEGGTIVLTPPLGNREVLMRVLGSKFNVAEYYHPNSRSAVDDLIRTQRNAMGISLLPHSNAGVEILKSKLTKGEVVTLCPDQQPRLRSGEFVPFFGEPALTSTVLALLIKQTRAPVVLGAALRSRQGFRVMLSPCPIDPGQPIPCVLTDINRHLEQAIRTHPGEYRWSDKRFNIRPPGMEKVYRRRSRHRRRIPEPLQ